MCPGLRVSQLMNIAFDMAAWVHRYFLCGDGMSNSGPLLWSVQEILGSLANGCTLFLRGKSSKEWRAVMKRIDIMIATPSMLGKYIYIFIVSSRSSRSSGPHDPNDYPNIKVVAVAGEACPQGDRITLIADNII